MSYKKLIHELMEKKEVPWEEVNEINEKAYEVLKKYVPNEYQNLKKSLECLVYKIELPEAETIVHNMKPRGQMWSYEQIKKYIEGKGIVDKFVDWYLVMNMCYNDYYNTAKMYGLQNEVDFYFNLAKDFIEDPDAEPHKVAKYFLG